MQYVSRFENFLEKHFSRLPNLDKETRGTLADFFPWITLFVGSMHVVMGWWLYEWAKKEDIYVGISNTQTSSYMLPVTKTGLSFWAWVAVVLLVVNGAIMLLAFPSLIKKVSLGWRLLFIAATINLIYGMAAFFISGRGAFVNLIGVALGSGIAFYLLFQIKEFYGFEKVSLSPRVKRTRAKSKVKK